MLSAAYILTTFLISKHTGLCLADLWHSMAGSEEQHPSLSTYELVSLIKSAGRIPIERDTLYNEVMDWSHHSFEEDTAYRGYVELPILN